MSIVIHVTSSQRHRNKQSLAIAFLQSTEGNISIRVDSRESTPAKSNREMWEDGFIADLDRKTNQIYSSN